jgi:hypothetical protein
MRRHHRQTRRYSGCSAQALTPEENERLLDRFLESLNDKIEADEAARRNLPHGVLAASADGGIPSVYGPFTNSIEAAAFARQLEQKLGAIDSNVHFQVIPIDSPE